MVEEAERALLLLVDTCGEQGSVALAKGGDLVAQVTLAERAASSGILGGVRAVLSAGQVTVRELSGVGVVNGPGSFTGVRVGLAVCKGLCEAAQLQMAAVSRLSVLAHAAGLRDGYAVLRAGRDQVYVLEVDRGSAVRERLVDVSALLAEAREREIVCTESSLVSVLEGGGARLLQIPLGARDALVPVRGCLAAGGSDLMSVDANYVRDEAAIYARRHADG